MVTDVHATFALFLPSRLTFHRKKLHMESINSMHFFGRMKVEVQKFMIHDITELSNCNRPARESYFDVHELIFSLNFCSSGSQLSKESFFVQRGSPRYRIGSCPWGMPVL